MKSFRAPKFRGRRFWRKAGLLAGSIVLLWLLISGGTNLYYKGYVRGRLQRWVSAATDSLYTVESGDVNINLFTRALTITDIHLWPDSGRLSVLRAAGHAPLNTLDIRIPSISLRGVPWRKLRKAGTVSIRNVRVEAPEIRWEQQPLGAVDEARAARPRPPAADNNVLQKISIAHLAIDNPSLSYASHEGAQPWAFTSKGGGIDVDDWQYLREAPRDTARLLGAAGIAATLDNVRWVQHDNPYALTAGSLRIDSKAGIGEATSFLLQRSAAAAPVRESYRLAIAGARCTGIDFLRALHRRQVCAAELSLRAPAITINHRRGVSRPDTTIRRSGHFPQQLLQDVPVPLQIPQVNISEGGVAYVEYNPKTSLTASLLFSNIEGRLTGVSNLRERPAACTATFGGKFMERSPMYAQFIFHLHDSLASFALRARLLELNGPQVSDAAQALALARIQKLHISAMNMDLKGSDIGTQATISVAYDRLKVHLQQIDEETGALYVRPLLSMLANKLMLYPTNPLPGEALRVAHTDVRRGPTESFFHLIWKNLFEATLQTAFRDEGMKAVLDHRKARKAEREEFGKRRFFRALGGKAKRKK